MRKLLILENDFIDFKNNHTYVGSFMNDWKKQFNGEVIVFDNLRHRSTESIYLAFKETDDIAVQTAFVNGSDEQLISFANLLANIPESKNIYIGNYDLKRQLENHLTDNQIYRIRHHNIYNMSFEVEFSNNDKIDFSKIINTVDVSIKIETEYKESAKQRLTGLKVKVLGCSAKGKAFENLPIGEVVDTLDMSETDPNPNRGVWIQGNGEPIKLVNDSGLDEYEIFKDSVSNENKLEAVLSSVSYSSPISNKDLIYIQHIINNPKEYLNAGNEICDTLGIERRGNRQRINNIL